MLAGNWPYITAAAHPDELLMARLQDVDLTKSLLLQVNYTVMSAVHYLQGHCLSACQWVTLSFCNTKVLHQTLNSTAKLWCKTLSLVKVDLVLHRT